MEENIWHVYPMNDTAEHQLTTEILHLPACGMFDENEVPQYIPSEDRVVCNCKCLPILKHEPSGAIIVVHNSYDGREGLEWTRDILNK